MRAAVSMIIGLALLTLFFLFISMPRQPTCDMIKNHEVCPLDAGN